jgi:hypothetical protein
MFYSILDSRIRHVDAAVVTIAVSTVPSMARTESKNTAEKTKNCDGGCDGARKYRAVSEVPSRPPGSPSHAKKRFCDGDSRK